MDVEGA